MSRAYSNDLRERILAAVNEGQKISLVSQVFKVCTRTMYRWMALQTKTATIPCAEKQGRIFVF